MIKQDPVEGISAKRKIPFFTKNKLIGAYVPKELADRIQLYSAYKKESKSKTMLDILQKEVLGMPPESQMLESICETALDNWRIAVESNHGLKLWCVEKLDVRWREYKKELQFGLNKILPKYYVNQVIRYIEEANF